MRAFVWLSLWIASAAVAQEPQTWVPSQAQAQILGRGLPVLEVLSSLGGTSGEMRAAIDIPVSSTAVWTVLLDCEKAPLMFPKLRSCRVLERDPKGRFDIREHVSKSVLFFPPIRSVFRSDYSPPYRISVHGIGGDFKVLEGTWTLVPLDGGAGTRAIYQGRASTKLPAPTALMRRVLRDQITAGLAALRREALIIGADL